MDIEVILFDLGGVLVELSGVGTMMQWSRLDETEIWHRWLHSEAVRKFESGKSTAAEFCQEVVREFELSTTPEVFMEAFVRWPSGLFDGVEEMLQRLSPRYHVSCLSNTNHLHWERFATETRLFENLHSHFASHHIGMMKPDIEIYRHVIQALDTAPGKILFFDDNQLNVEGARTAGMNALLARGLGDVERHLEVLGL